MTSVTRPCLTFFWLFVQAEQAHQNAQLPGASWHGSRSLKPQGSVSALDLANFQLPQSLEEILQQHQCCKQEAQI